MNRVAAALREALRRFKLSGNNGAAQEDTVTLDDGGSGGASSSNTQSNLSGSQVRLFKQQKRPNAMSLAGSKIGKKRKISALSQDSGHCNAFEITVGKFKSFFSFLKFFFNFFLFFELGIG